MDSCSWQYLCFGYDWCSIWRGTSVSLIDYLLCHIFKTACETVSEKTESTLYPQQCTTILNPSYYSFSWTLTWYWLFKPGKSYPLNSLHLLLWLLSVTSVSQEIILTLAIDHIHAGLSCNPIDFLFLLQQILSTTQICHNSFIFASWLHPELLKCTKALDIMHYNFTSNFLSFFASA